MGNIYRNSLRGKNHFWELYEIAQHSTNWFCSKLTVEDTQHISIHEIEKEVDEGLISQDLSLQEYYTSFDMGVEGAYYSKYMDKMRVAGRISTVPYENTFPVFTAWDLGVRDQTCIIFYQIIGQTVRIIDCYASQKEGLEHYVNVIKNKPYWPNYAKHFAPHDIAVQEFGSGITRLEKAKRLGLKFETKMDRLGHTMSAVPNISIMDGIETCRSTFAKIWIDEVNCKDLIKALENYRQEYDARTKTYANRPLHNWASHYADAFRYLCLSLPKTQDGLSAEDLDRQYNQYLNKDSLPKFFQEPFERF